MLPRSKERCRAGIGEHNQYALDAHETEALPLTREDTEHSQGDGEHSELS